MKTIAYYVWASQNTVVLYLTDPAEAQASILAIGSVPSGSAEEITRHIGSTLAKVPNAESISYVDETDKEHWQLKALDLATRKSTFLANMPEGVDNYAWLPDGSLVAGHNSKILRWSREDPVWRNIADIGEKAAHGITRVVVDGRGDQMVIVVALQ